jgi:hypothetical protein
MKCDILVSSLFAFTFCGCCRYGEGMPVAVRHVESIIRMSEARASMRLSEHVSSEDIDGKAYHLLTLVHFFRPHSAVLKPLHYH